MFRYMTLIWNVAVPSQADAAELLTRRLKSLSSQWREVFDHEGMRVLCADIRSGSLEPHALASNAGVILGTLFERNADAEEDTASRRASLAQRETTAILNSQGRWLSTQCWGNYVAFIAAPAAGTKWVLKDPVGNLPCFHTQYRGVTVLFSAIADCLDLQLLSFTVNRSYLESRLVDGGSSQEHSPLQEVSQVYRGECVEFDTSTDPATRSSRFHWTPQTFTSADRSIEDAGHAARAMRATVRGVTQSLAGCHQNILLRLSGGLDSSIVNGCLAGVPSRPRITCYTHYNPRGRSDERPWARMAAQHSGFEHVECAVVPEDITLESALQMPASVEPASVLEFLQRSTMERQLAGDRAATAVFNGDGGDSGFCSDSINYALADYLRLHGPTRAAFRLAPQVALLTGLSTWTVIRRSLRIWRSGASTVISRETLLKACRLVNPPIMAAFNQGEQYGHPWFRGVDRVPAGLLRRAGMLLATPDFYTASTDVQAFAPEVLAPLYAQPAMELFLRIPIHVHFEEGRDRGLARRAFVNEVPRPILQRHWKDRAPGFHDELIHRNLGFLREFFLDGVLVNEGLLDRAAVEKALSTAPAKSQVFPGEIINHMGTEMWARHWIGGARQRAAA